MPDTFDGRSYEIVGVVKDAHFDAAGEPAVPSLFRSYWQAESTDAFARDSRTHVRVAGNPQAMMATLGREIAAIDPNVPVTENHPVSDLVAYTFRPVRMARAMLVGFGLLALFLSAVGLYGVLAFTVSQRAREIGIRVALGAEGRDVAGLVLRESVRITCLGAALGLAGAWMSARWVGSLLYGIDPHDITTFVIAPIVLLIVALTASYFPAVVRRRYRRLSRFVTSSALSALRASRSKMLSKYASRPLARAHALAAA